MQDQNNCRGSVASRVKRTLSTSANSSGHRLDLNGSCPKYIWLKINGKFGRRRWSPCFALSFSVLLILQETRAYLQANKKYTQQATEQALAVIVQYWTTTTVSNVGVEEHPHRMWKMILIHIQLFCKSNYRLTPIICICNRPPPTHVCGFMLLCGQLVRNICYAAQQCNVTCECIFLQWMFCVQFLAMPT